MSKNWESLIAQRMRPCARMAEDVARQRILERERKREASPERKEQHKAWNATEKGRKSMAERGARYRATDKGHENALRKSRKYYEAHKDIPEWKERRNEYNRNYRRMRKEAA